MNNEYTPTVCFSLTMDVARYIEASVRSSFTLIWKLSPIFPDTRGPGSFPLARTAL